MDEKRYYSRSASTASRLVANEAVIVKLPDGEMTILNSAGSLVWHLLDGSRDLAAIESETRIILDSDTINVKIFIETLSAGGLLDSASVPSASPSAFPRPAAIQNTKPEIKVSEKLEVLAALCSSGLTGQPWDGECRTVSIFSCESIVS